MGCGIVSVSAKRAMVDQRINNAWCFIAGLFVFKADGFKNKMFLDDVQIDCES